MNDLPSGWSITTIGDVTEYISRGKAPKYTDKSPLPIVNQKAIRWSGIQNEHLKFVHEDQFDQWTDERFIREGDVLWNSTGTGTIGRACLVRPADLSPPKVVDSHVTIVRPKSGALDPRYLFAWIRGPEVQGKIEDLATGTTNQIELGRGTVIATRIPLAPLPEQKRISDKLDALLARMDACRARLKRIPAILERFRQAVLTAATNGDLTREWRDERGFDLSGWEATTVSTLIDGKPRNGYSPRAVERRTAVKSLTLTATTNGDFRGEHFKYIDEEIPPNSYLWLVPGDILIQRANTIDYVGVSAIFDGPPATFIYPDLMMKCRANERILTPFLHYVLSSERVRAFFRENATGTAGNMPKINQQTVLSAPALLPPLDEQREVVRRMEILLAFIEQLDLRYRAALRPIERLTSSMLAKAFRGELVPQDPRDEPASELLARIRSRQEVPRQASKPIRRSGIVGSHTKTKAETDMLTRKDVTATHLTSILQERGALTPEALWNASQLEIDDFYDQLKDEEARGLLREKRSDAAGIPTLLEPAA